MIDKYSFYVPTNQYNPEKFPSMINIFSDLGIINAELVNIVSSAKVALKPRHKNVSNFPFQGNICGLLLINSAYSNGVSRYIAKIKIILCTSEKSEIRN